MSNLSNWQSMCIAANHDIYFFIGYVFFIVFTIISLLLACYVEERCCSVTASAAALWEPLSFGRVVKSENAVSKAGFPRAIVFAPSDILLLF